MWESMLALLQIEGSRAGRQQTAGRIKSGPLPASVNAVSREQSQGHSLGAVHGCSLTVPEVGSCNSKGLQRLKHLLPGPVLKRFAKPCSRKRLHRGSP